MTAEVFVSKLPDAVRKRDVEAFFQTYGKIQSTALRSGYCFVKYYDVHAAEAAVANTYWELEDAKIIEPSTSMWGAPIFSIKKKLLKVRSQSSEWLLITEDLMQ